ncbi:MAG: hypothetical protein NTV86_17060 [Planctomycetota bacterium]|nr:hypothetical protein [Planctomycetota bacterium]
MPPEGTQPSISPPPGRHAICCLAALVTLAASLTGLGAEPSPAPEIVADWASQDGLYAGGPLQTAVVAKVVNSGELGESGNALKQELASLANVGAGDGRWLDLYKKACDARRRQRLSGHAKLLSRVVFTKHFDMGGSHYAYTEAQSDAQHERNFAPGASLCLMEMDGAYAKVKTLIDDRNGVLRDPDVSFDGQRILFSWKKSDRQDDYHLYETPIAGGAVRQITQGLGFADYEGAYLPNGDLIFSSTRCVQTVDCWWTEVSNLYTCDAAGRYLRRLGFDQVHTNFPTVTPDGRVIYTRWDYNDRGQIFPQALFQMRASGMGQTELYGNNSWFPTTLLHARAIPGTAKYVAVFSGHHTRQTGWLGIVDPSKGRQENSGTQLIAPVRATPAVREDAYGQSGDQFQYPYPLSETEFLVALRPQGARRYAIYFVRADARRELLAWDATISCNQPVPVAQRHPGAMPGDKVDYRKTTGLVYMQDVYQGPGLAGVKKGTIKKLRVVALDFRAAGVGSNGNSGPAGGALVSTPISIEGAWDVKTVLGTVEVGADGSACFEAPARTPIYFQPLDADGFAAGTMRSWLTVQPGETVSCVGCHENKNAAPPAASYARRFTLQKIAGLESARGFSFHREIQPILDAKCVSCHAADAAGRAGPKVKPAFSLQGAPGTFSPAYVALANRRWCDWVSPQSVPEMLPPYSTGAAKSKLIALLRAGHYDARLTAQELDRLAAWIDLGVPCFGDYTEGLDAGGKERYRHFLQKRLLWQQQELLNIQAYIRDRN